MRRKNLIIPLVLVFIFCFTVPAYAKTENPLKANIKSENPINVAASEEIIKNNKNYNQGNLIVDTNYNERGKFFISGVLSDKKTPTEKAALTFLEQNKTLFGIDNAVNNFKLVSSDKDNLGYTHVRLNQYISGLPVKDRQVVVHFNKQGNIIAINGDVYSNNTINKLGSKEISENDAIKAAKSQFKYNKLGKEPSAKKVAVIVNDKIYEAYEVNIKYNDPEFANWNVYVDVGSGKIVDKQSNIRMDNAATGTGVGVDGRTKSLNLYYTTANSTYSLRDTTKPMSGTIYTTSANNGNTYPGSMVTNTTNTFNSESYKAGVDAHYYAGVVYDFYKTLFNRNSINNAGMSIRSTVHISNGYNNAFWDGDEMVYGDGDGRRFTYLSGDLDVVAHEMTHGVTQYSGGLQYSYQSGALNESYSDVFGVLIDSYDKYNVKNGGQWQFNAADWVVGDKVFTPSIPGDALRSLANPTLYNQPDNMDNYLNTSEDDGGVHTNSGIPNKAAFLIAQSIGMQKTAAIYYRSYNYLNPTISFSGAANAIKQAAADLYGSSSTEVTAVNTAFRTVKVLVNDTYEPNDTMQTAFRINTGTVYRSYIATSSDVDYYKLEVNSAKNIDVNLTNLPRDYDIVLYNSSGTILASSTGTASSEHINCNITTAGNYYLKIYGFSGAFDASTQYSLKVDIIEPRGNLDTPAANAQVTGTTDVRGYFLDKLGIQKVEVLIDGTVKGQAVYGDARADIYQAYPIYNNPNSGFHYSLNTIGISNGTHSITVRATNNSGIQTTLASKNITVNNTTVQDTYEPNNSIETAYIINTGTEYQSLIYSSSDVDYYKLAVSSPKNIDINLTNLPHDYDIILYNSAGSSLASSTGVGSSEHINYNITVPGNYYIKVYGYGGAYNISRKYSLKVDVIAPRGLLESPASNAQVTGTINVRGYFLDKLGIQKVEVLIDGTVKGQAVYGDARADIYQAYPIYNNPNSGFHYSLNTIGIANGTHSITVRATNNSGVQTTLSSRTISVNNTPPPDTYESNNSIGTAYTINMATTYQSFIYSNTDVDYYKFTADTVGNIEINLTNLPNDYDIQLVNASGTILKASYAFGTGAERISYNIKTTGTYYIRVYGDSGFYDKYNKYSLRVDKLNSRGLLETPVANSTISGSVNVKGWYLDGNGIAKVEVLVDGVIRGKAVYGDVRTDVNNANPTYHNNNSGFHYTLDTRRFSNGNHTITVKMTNNEGYTQTLSNRTVTILN